MTRKSKFDAEGIKNFAKLLGVDHTKISLQVFKTYVNMHEKLTEAGAWVGDNTVNENEVPLTATEIFEDLEDLATMVIEGIQPSLLVTGLAGIGKTYIITKLCEDMLGEEGDKWIHIKGKVTPLGLYSTLFMNRDKLIVFDDCDSVFDNETSVNMLKAALDSYENRTITWASDKTADISKMDESALEAFYAKIYKAFESGDFRGMKLPNKFEFTGTVIFISNLTADKVDSAVKSRSFTIDINLSANQIVDRMEELLPHLGDGEMKEKEEVLEFIRKSAHDADREVNFRTFINALRCKRSGSKRWERLVECYA